MGRRISICVLLLGLVCPQTVGADVPEEDDESKVGTAATSGLPVDGVPDLRDDESELTVQTGDFVVVPIPMSSPTFGTGLIVGAAYFYPQTAEQKASQPASFTGAAGVYTSNDSWAGGIGQMSYWAEDTWRFSGFAGYADFKFVLRDPETGGSTGGLDWTVEGLVSQATLSRRIAGHWYAGVIARYLDITQTFDTSPDESDESDDSGFGFDSQITSVGAGLKLEYDTRDVPTNAYTGRRFETRAIFSSANGIDTSSYLSYYLRLRSYHQVAEPLVVAWDVNGCTKNGSYPLWDTCRLTLRGFPVTDYLGRQSISGQIEARWRASTRWGFVAFAGAGHVAESFSAQGKSERVPSFGVGVRFMVLQSKRVNFRVDYARSDNSDAWYIAVGEAF